MKTLTIKFFVAAVLMVLCAQSAGAQGWDARLYSEIEGRIHAPEFRDKVYDVTKYGASEGASAAKNQKAINKAIAVCSKKGGGVVLVPKGQYVTGAIRLLSNVNLRVEEGATLLFAFEPELYPLVRTRWEGLDIMNYSPCIYAKGAVNVAVSGKGTIDGNGSMDTWWPWCGSTKYGFEAGVTKESQAMPWKGDDRFGRDAQGEVLSNRNTLLQMSDEGVPVAERRFGMGHGMRPQLVNFFECENVLVEDVTLLRSPFWVVHPVLSRNVTVRRCTIVNDGPNGDGCDPESCEDVLIEDCLFRTGDDCIAIKSGRNADGRRAGRASRNIIVRRCTMQDGHGGVVIGSEISGGVQNVFAEDCKMDSPNLDRVLRIKTNTCRGGVTEGMYMRNVEVGECREAVMRINLVYEPKERSKRGFVPTVRNVYMENVTCKKSRYGVLLNGLEESCNIYNVEVKNCTFEGVKDEPVRRTGQSRNVRFENLVVNGNCILAERPFKRYSQWMTWSEMERVKQPYYLDFTDTLKRPEGKWSYVMGIELESMLDVYKEYGDKDVLQYVSRYPEKMISQEGSVTGYKLKDYNLDNVRTAHFLLRMNEVVPRNGNEIALKTLFRQLEEQPRTKEGVWWHKAIYANQVWLDGIFMGLPYYVAAAEKMKGKKGAKRYYDDAVEQITRTFNRTYDAETGLWKHAWDETHSIFWANKDTGLSQHTWARAMGWFAMAMVEVLDALPEDYTRRSEVKEMLGKMMGAVVRYQDKDTGVWRDVLDVVDERNYLESTASCMFAYCLLKGVRKGYIDASFIDAGKRAYEGVLKQFVRVNRDATISLTRCCSVSGLGPEKNPKRDGSFEYYMSEPIRDNDAKGIGPFIWASLEMERLAN